MMHRFNGRFWSIAEKALLFGTMALLLLYAVIFYKERIIFNDTINGIIDMFRKDHPSVTTNRYTSLFGELLPYVAYKLNASLRVIIFLHSLNLILIPVGLAALSVRWFRDTKTAWTILLFYTIQSAHLFYYPVSEFQIGLCCFLFYIGFLKYAEREDISVSPTGFWIMALLAVPTIIFSHPLSMPVFFAWVLFELATSRRTTWAANAGIALLGALSYLLKRLFFHAAFDDGRQDGLKYFKTLNASILDAPLTQSFLKALADDYFLMPVLLVLSVIALVRQRHSVAAILFPGIIFTFFVLVTVTFQSERYNYYYEHLYQTITFFVALVIGRFFTTAFKPMIYVPLLLIVLVISGAKIYGGHERMTRRLYWYENCFRMMDRKHITKAIVANSRLDIGWHMDANWLTCFESLVLSALDSPSRAKTITVVWDEERARPVATNRNAFVDVGLGTMPLDYVPKRYFSLDASRYTILSDSFPHNEIMNLSYGQP